MRLVQPSRCKSAQPFNGFRKPLNVLQRSREMQRLSFFILPKLAIFYVRFASGTVLGCRRLVVVKLCVFLRKVRQNHPLGDRPFNVSRVAGPLI